MLTLFITAAITSLSPQSSLSCRDDAALHRTLDTLVAAAAIGADGELVLNRHPRDGRFLEPRSGAYFQISGDGREPLRSRSLWDLSLPVHLAASPSSSRSLDGGDLGTVRIAERDVQLPGSLVRWRFQVAVTC